LDNVNVTGIGLLSALRLMHYVGSVGAEVKVVPEKEKEKIGDLQKGIALRARASLFRLFDWIAIIVVFVNDFYDFPPNYLFFIVVTYLFYRLGLEASPHIFRIFFGKKSFLTTGKSKHLFALCLVTLFSGISFGGSPELNLISAPELFPIGFISSMLVGGLLFIYFFGKEMLIHSDLPKLAGPIPSFWRRVERTGANDDYRKQWKNIQSMPSSNTKRLATVIWIYSPCTAIFFLAFVLAWLLYLTLHFSLVLDAILVAWLIITFLSRLGLTSIRKKLEADTERTLVQSVFSGYYRFGPKTIFVSVCLISTVVAIIANSSPFIVVSLALPSALTDIVRLRAMSVVLILFTPLVSYQLYFWWLLLKRSSVFLRVWNGLSVSTRKVKALPHWSTFLFLATWHLLILQEFLLGRHFYPFKGVLSLSFLISLNFNDATALVAFTLLSIAYWIAFIKLLRIRETNVAKSEILRDNILYGLIPLSLWTSEALIWYHSQGDFPRSVIIVLYITVSFAYSPNIARIVDNKFSEGSWTKRICYFGFPITLIGFFFLLASALSFLDALSAFISIVALVALFLFFLWFDAKMEKTRTHK